MAHINTLFWRRTLLLVGVGLSALTALEIGTSAFGAQHQEIHAEHQLSSPSTNKENHRSFNSSIADLPVPPNEAIFSNAPELENSGSDSIAAASIEVIAEPESTLTAQDKTLAVNSEPSNGTIQQNLTNRSPEEFAIAAWAGASFPVENFQAYTSPFGYRRSPTGGYRQEFHYGLDIAAPQGSYIRSWWSGKVVEVSDNSNCGTSLVIQSGSWMHIYCHMQGRMETQNGRRYLIDRESGLQVWEGQDILAGNRIGRVGMTGRTTGPHLHWGLKYQGNWVDPAWVIRAMSVSQQAMGQ